MKKFLFGLLALVGLAGIVTAQQLDFSPAPAVAPIKGTGATITASTPLIDVSQTWNSGAVTFNAGKINITDTASASASTLLDLQVGSASKFRVLKGGAIQLDNTTAGIERSGGYLMFNTSGGTIAATAPGGIQTNGAFSYQWSQGAVGDTTDLILARDAANSLAQRNGTNSQTANFYDTYTSSSDYHRIAIKTARATLSNVSGASVTATSLIPDGAVLVGLTTKVTTGLGTSNGTTGYQVGDGSDADRWGAVVGTASGTSSDNRDWTAGTITGFTAAQNVVITAVGGNFNGTGVIYVSAQYLIGQSD